MSAAVAIEELTNIGCKYFIRVGTCGSLSPEINPGDIIIATGAVRGDGASKEYVPIEYPAVADYHTVTALRNRAKKEDTDYKLGIIWNPPLPSEIIKKESPSGLKQES
jgi:uridine phosphorylase